MYINVHRYINVLRYINVIRYIKHRKIKMSWSEISADNAVQGVAAGSLWLTIAKLRPSPS